jgi:AbrB family looped-hinge helix DNA binding protein
MNMKIDKFGRLVLPKPIRDQLGITPEAEVELVQRPDGVLLRKVAQQPSMREVDGLWIHQGTASAQVDWSGVVDSVREERADEAWKP